MTTKPLRDQDKSVGPHDSPRWCDYCQVWGNHHTDRHPEPDCAGCGNKISGHVKPWDANDGRVVHPNKRCAIAAVKRGVGV